MENGIIVHNIENKRFEMHFKDGFAFAKYNIKDKIMTVEHVEVPESMRGQGVGNELMTEFAAFCRSWTKREGLTLKPACSYARDWLKKHEEYHDFIEF